MTTFQLYMLENTVKISNRFLILTIANLLHLKSRRLLNTTYHSHIRRFNVEDGWKWGLVHGLSYKNTHPAFSTMCQLRMPLYPSSIVSVLLYINTITFRLSPILSHQVKTQYLHFRSHTKHFRLAWWNCWSD